MPAEPTQRFALPRWRGEVLASLGQQAVSQVDRLADPAAATATIHWGRNYLYATELETDVGKLEVVVKQFRNQGLRRRLERRLKGSKAERSWTAARALAAAGIGTARPLLLVESTDPEGPSLFVTEWLTDVFEVRHLFRRLRGDPAAGAFPEVAPELVMRELGRLARRLHDAGIVYRDLSIGNVLVRPRGGDLDLFLVDPNRARLGCRPGLYARCHDLCRFPIAERAHREAYLGAYWGEVPSLWSPRFWLWLGLATEFLLKHAVKNRLRSLLGRRPPSGGHHHAHIPKAASGASARDLAVWDHLSDQPHQHAGKLAKLAIRLADSGSHLRDLALVAGAAPRIARRYRELKASLYQQPVALPGLGVGLRPFPADPAGQLAALEELGVRSVLLRLHPWEPDHASEERLARELSGRGVELAFALPQNRDLVRDRARWRAAVAELGERFVPYGKVFQVGQAPNRSKWGIWTRSEYVELFVEAAELLRQHPGVELIGPAVIDFELQATAAIVNRRRPGLAFDAVSSLLYVDRRGAPENRQLGFDTVNKVALLRAIAETGHSCAPRCWVTEVNWPLWEGPHSPAGRKVSVDEDSQASYLVRYALLTLGTGLVERVFWWQLIARGYGLVDPQADGTLRRRPSFVAMRTLLQQLDGATCHGPMAAPPGAYLYRLDRDGEEVLVGWSLAGAVPVTLERPAHAVVGRDGQPVAAGRTTEVELTPAPRYFWLAGE